MKLKINICLFAFLFLFIWTLLALYPNPYYLGKSIYHVFKHPVNSDSNELSFFLQNFNGDNQSPKEIEDFVLKNFTYNYDWNVYNMPWYFPTAKEALRKGEGDCKSKFIVIASAFEKFNISYDLYLSINHIWINYEEKKGKGIENEKKIILSTGEKIILKKPEIDIEETKEIFKKAAINPMPIQKKNLLYLGCYFASFFFFTIPIIDNRQKIKLLNYQNFLPE